MSYYPPMQSPFMMPQIPQIMPQVPPQQQTVQYVNDRASVDSYQLPANSSVILMDSNLPRFYLKQTDASGMATVKSYDFKETEKEKPKEYVTKEEFESFKASMKGGRHESNNESTRKQ